MTRAEEIAWAAGLFEGEGSIGREFVQLASTDEDVVRRFVEIVGVGKIYGPYRTNRLAKKPIWKWKAGKKANRREVIELLRPYLGARRGAMADYVLANPVCDVGKGRLGFRKVAA